MLSDFIGTAVNERSSFFQTWYRGAKRVCLWKVIYVEEKFAKPSKETMSSNSTGYDQRKAVGGKINIMNTILCRYL